jgi:hypothetical protein
MLRGELRRLRKPRTLTSGSRLGDRVAPADWIVAVWDTVYRRWHGLDAPPAKIPPVLSISFERAWRVHRLADGTVLRPGDRFGQLHLDNGAVAALRRNELSPVRLGLTFRQQLRVSLATLARLSAADDRYAGVRAFSAITIFHQGLARLGFEVEPGGLIAPRITGAYQHALLLSLAARPGPHRAARAGRLWISRRALVALYGPLRRVS